MNLQPNNLDKPDVLGQLSQIWGLTPTNEALARAYLTNDQADEDLLTGAERQVFASFDWLEQREICACLQEITAPEHAKNQAKVLKFLWAVGRSTAGFAALFDQRGIYSDAMVSDSAFRQRCEVLGTAAAAAMDAECLGTQRIGRVRIKRLHQLAGTDPDTLLEAQKLTTDPQYSRASGVLAGFLLAAAKPRKEKPGLVGGFLHGVLGAVWDKEGLRLERQVEVVLFQVERIVASAAQAGLSTKDIAQLKAYFYTGDPAAPVPATSVPTVWDVPERSRFSYSLDSDSAVEYAAPLVLFGLRNDARLACAMRVLSGLNLSGVLHGVFRFLPEDGELDSLDALLPHIPGGAAALLRFAARELYEDRKELVRKLACRFRDGAEEALQSAEHMEEYSRLCSLFPAQKRSQDGVWIEWTRSQIISFMERVFKQDPHQDTVCGYLDGQGALADSAAILGPVRNEYRYLSNMDEALHEYQKLAGWDDFACRCVVLFCLTCTGYATAAAFLLEKDKKANLDAFVNAVLAGGLPVRDCVTVLVTMRENWYREEDKKLIEAAVQEHFITPERVDALADVALNASAPARIMAVEGLDQLSALPACGQKARKALIACAGDPSKQVQELLVERYISHPDWEGDYLSLLEGKKVAQRSLAVRALAGIGAEKYRGALENALAREKNARVMDQIITLLGGESSAAGVGAQSPAELAAQVLKGGKKRKVQWLLDQPLPPVCRTDEAHTAAPEDQIAALFVACADLGRMGRSDTAAAIAADLESKDLEALAGEVWERWIKEGAQSKTKWVLSFVVMFGGTAMTPKLIHAINDWPQNFRGALACDAVTALAVSPDPAALMAVDSISRKFKFRQVKAAAAAALGSAAQELGITPEELADRIVPTLGFAPNGTRVFDYGPRQFTVHLTPSLELAVTTGAGKAVKSMPSPGKSDDAGKAPAAYEAYKALKKQIKTTVAAQRARLEMALSTQRCWDSQAWRKLFVDNPVMHQFAISLIWGVYENGQLKGTFRYMEDGSFNTVDEEEYTLPEGASIGLVHPIELEEETLAAWKQQLEDYEILPSIEQLTRPIYRLPPEQAHATALETVAGRILNILSLMGKLQGMGWYRGSVLDGGGFFTFYREDPSVGIGVELNFSGSYVGGDDEDVTVFDAVFYKADTVQRGSYCYDEPAKENIFLLGQVPARYYSEVVWQLERATASSTGTDSHWRRTKNG